MRIMLSPISFSEAFFSFRHAILQHPACLYVKAKSSMSTFHESPPIPFEEWSFLPGMEAGFRTRVFTIPIAWRLSECDVYISQPDLAYKYPTTRYHLLKILLTFRETHEYSRTMTLAILVALYAYLGCAAALSKEGWRSQSIYQLLTDRYARTNGSQAACSDLGDYCGGSWQGIINNLDYIQDMGFTAIWISPITENIQGLTYEGAAYHGFWPQQINQVNSNFGTAADLQALSNALHGRGMVC